jgi:TusA-related sulfurtransferase
VAAVPDDTAPEHALDLTGEVCPFTFVRTKLALEGMAVGTRLRIVVDHEPATRNIPRSAQEWGQEVVGVTAISGGSWAIVLRRLPERRR